MDISMVLVECCSCHIQFAMSKVYDDALRRCHNTFYCPEGHPQSYSGRSDIERAKEERDIAQRLLNSTRAELESLKKKKRKQTKKQ